jgi:hypothetical protein
MLGYAIVDYSQTSATYLDLCSVVHGSWLINYQHLACES